MSDRILTVRQPWATAIMRHGKNVENRTWGTDYRGRLWIHAGRIHDKRVPLAILGGQRHSRAHLLDQVTRDRGCVLGYVTLTDIIQDSDSPWAEPDQYHWLLDNPVPLTTPIPRRGTQGLTHYPHPS